MHVLYKSLLHFIILLKYKYVSRINIIIQENTFFFMELIHNNFTIFLLNLKFILYRLSLQIFTSIYEVLLNIFLHQYYMKLYQLSKTYK
jgi:hypothetical protein